MKLEEAISKRHSIRKFSSKNVKWSDILEAIDSAAKIPLAGNTFNLKFLIVSSQELKNEIAKHCQQLWISEAPYIIVVCSDESRLKMLYDSRGSIYSRQQAGASIQNLLLKLTEMKLASCWVGAYADELVKQILRIPENINIEAIIPVGYSSEKPRTKNKVSLENIIFWEFWKQKKKPFPFKDPLTI